MKVWNYVFIAITMILMFQFLGINQADTGGISNFTSIEFGTNSSDQSTYLKGFDLVWSSFFSYLNPFDGSSAGFFSILIGAGAAIGLAWFGKADIAIKAGFAVAVLAYFVPVFYIGLNAALTDEVAPWAIGIIAMFVIPFSIGFLFALVEYIVGGGSD